MYCTGVDIVTFIKSLRLRWYRHPERINDQIKPIKLTARMGGIQEKSKTAEK
jgi:hypothetical protein